VQSASGVVHDVVPDDRAALERVRAWLSYFPSSAWEAPRRVEGSDTGRREVPELASLIPRGQRTPYDIRLVLERVCDAGSVFEVQARYGASLVTALARLGGESVAVVANQPAVRAGVVDVPAAAKAAHFLELAAAFHLPLLLLADNPGVLPGPASERAGVLRASARMYAAQSRHPGPKLHVTLRKAYGFGSSIMGMNPFDGQTISLALPGAQLGAMPAAGAADATRAADEDRARLTAAEIAGGMRAAEWFSYDDVVAPEELRDALLAGLRLAAGRRSGPWAPLARMGISP
jgi:acetyl-CoA carboxylase carboxyltransferase component